MAQALTFTSDFKLGHYMKGKHSGVIHRYGVIY